MCEWVGGFLFRHSVAPCTPTVHYCVYTKPCIHSNHSFPQPMASTLERVFTLLAALHVVVGVVVVVVLVRWPGWVQHMGWGGRGEPWQHHAGARVLSPLYW